MSRNVIPLHPLLPKIESISGYAEEWRLDRLEMLAQFLWQVLLELRGLESANRFPVFIRGLHDRHGNLQIDWRSREVMDALRPAAKFGWGVLDVAAWRTPVTVDHNYPGKWFTDEYSSEEAEFFARLQTNCGGGEREALGCYGQPGGITYPVSNNPQRLLSGERK